MTRKPMLFAVLILLASVNLNAAFRKHIDPDPLSIVKAAGVFQK